MMTTSAGIDVAERELHDVAGNKLGRWDIDPDAVAFDA